MTAPRPSIPQAHPGVTTTVGHLTDAQTGNVYPILVASSGRNSSPPAVMPGTKPLAKAPPTPGACAFCDAVQPYVPLLIVGGLVLLVVLLYLGAKE